MIRSLLKSSLLLAAAVLSAACTDVETESATGTAPAPACAPKDGPLPHDKLSDYCFFKGDMKDLAPADDAVPYDVAAALWSDHAAKQRLLVLPKGQKIKFNAGENWQFPAGTIIVKTFSFY